MAGQQEGDFWGSVHFILHTGITYRFLSQSSSSTTTSCWATFVAPCSFTMFQRASTVTLSKCTGACCSSRANAPSTFNPCTPPHQHTEREREREREKCPRQRTRVSLCGTTTKRPKHDHMYTFLLASACALSFFLLFFSIFLYPS
jgi:hypothetical protein